MLWITFKFVGVKVCVVVRYFSTEGDNEEEESSGITWRELGMSISCLMGIYKEEK